MSRPASADIRRSGVHGSPEESILIDRQSTPQQKVNASPLLRQSSIGAKQGRMSQTCARLTALVLLANAMVAMYLFLGTGRGGTSWAGHFVKSIHGKSSSSSGMATTLWSRVDSSNFEPQSTLWGEPETAAEAESWQGMGTKGARKEGRDQKGKPSTSWLHKAKSAVGGAFGGRAVTRGDGVASSISHPEVATDGCSAALDIPKVAMMFLTRGEIHQEPLWKLWFQHLAGMVPVSALRIHDGCAADQIGFLQKVCGPAARGNVIQQQHLFNVYVHVGANEVNFTGFPETSIFYGRDIKARVHVDWGTFSLVAALKELIMSGLEDRLNQKFMLISESGIPLYPGETMWVELMVEEKSRINACELGTLNNMYHRWTPEMETDFLKQHHWRKSSQWVTLRRDHAQIIGEDKELADIFIKWCYMEWQDNNWRDCYSDEHYLSTLLASKGLDNETDCFGGTTYTSWQWGQAHPQAFGPDDINPDKIREMRQPQAGCNAPSAIITAAAQFIDIADVTPQACSTKPIDYSYSLGYHCPIMARKFSQETAPAIAQLLSECSNHLNIVTSAKCQQFRRLMHVL
ncbi:g12101 [Coccomyxa viridis]|uniref:G12101 protein n=1 Tax=Coccomyxa viridis TaxID=1274662 RepID=A0ABP1G9J3_9CHLO